MIPLKMGHHSGGDSFLLHVSFIPSPKRPGKCRKAQMFLEDFPAHWPSRWPWLTPQPSGLLTRHPHHFCKFLCFLLEKWKPNKKLCTHITHTHVRTCIHDTHIHSPGASMYLGHLLVCLGLAMASGVEDICHQASPSCLWVHMANNNNNNNKQLMFL